MTNTVIKVNNISKRYRIGVRERADTFAGQLKNAILYPLHNFRNITRLKKFNKEDDPSIFWALRDINFEVQKGEVLGIIGHNGAGKSTLLKILSHITEPTTGEIQIRGRVSALLEVGTGFHPELTGRDNVYMNGTILGMTKREIDQKFDEIVSFAGVDRHIDTPVKFYSSGMKVRLGFSVAAHLEPEILVIDEVLAVGDLGFQQKCLGKMDEVSKSGRTVLFVSHNMGAIEGLCTQAIVLNNGEITLQSNTSDAIKQYIQNISNKADNTIQELGSKYLEIEHVLVEGENGSDLVFNGQNLKIKLRYQLIKTKSVDNLSIALHISKDGSTLFTLNPKLVGTDYLKNIPDQGEIVCEVPRLQLVHGRYFISLYIQTNFEETIRLENIYFFDVENGPFFENGRVPNTKGLFMVDQLWELNAR